MLNAHNAAVRKLSSRIEFALSIESGGSFLQNGFDQTKGVNFFWRMLKEDGEFFIKPNRLEGEHFLATDCLLLQRLH